MSPSPDREHFIPIYCRELVHQLLQNPALSKEERPLFRNFCKLVSARIHYDYHDHLEKLKRLYAPFDPDADIDPDSDISLSDVTTPADRGERLQALFREFEALVRQANYRELTRDELEEALELASLWGIRMDVDFSVFDRFAVFARGDTKQVRRRRAPWKLFVEEAVEVPVYRRLAIILKLKPSRRLGSQVDTNSVLLKLFKDIPKPDLDMLLPGARVRMTNLDRGKIGLPLITGLGMAMWRMADDILGALFRSGANPSLLLWGLATGAIGYGTRSLYNYLGTKQRYYLTLTQSLYHQSLDSNAGVFTRLLDEAEEQDACEVILGYYYLLRQDALNLEWTVEDLDKEIENYLYEHFHCKVDFDVKDAVRKLERLRLVVVTGGKYRALPLPEALKELDHQWDNFFRFNERLDGVEA
ncbi:MAG: TMEM143 family protein [Gemmataceae bacterium]|nr:TMEM143 family protein [Gemmataceae bacterium]MDW8264295.1 DUF3754 domain-containing protein [Gemmataceae bacterium]